MIKNQKGQTRRAKGGKQSKGRREQSDLGKGPKTNYKSLSGITEVTTPLFPARTHRRLRYFVPAINIATVAGAITGNYVFAANGVFDPDVTAGSHQPMGFDQMMLFYEHYVCVASKMTVQAQNTAGGSLHIGVRTDTAVTAITSVTQIIEYGRIQYDVLESKNGYGSCKLVSADVDVGKMQGIKRSEVLVAENLRGDIAANPTELTYYHVMAWDPNGLSGTVVCDITIDFDVWFIEPRTQILSAPAVVAAIRRAALERKTG